MMSEVVIKATDVVKQIGQQRILDQVSLHVAAGEVVGFIGPNGAGKTTLLRILSGMTHATSGSITVCGYTLDEQGVAPPDLAIVPETPGFIDHLSGVENLRLLASIRNRIGIDEIRNAIAQCGLDPANKRPVAKYSLGMRQRLSLAQAIMERPRALLLDEPTNGLDVVGITDLRALIRQQAVAGVAVFLASHLLSEVERACDRVLIVQNGRVKQEISTAQLRQSTNRVRVRVSNEQDRQKLQAMFEIEQIAGLEQGTSIVKTDLTTPQLNRRLVALDIDVEELGPYTVSLEQTFLERIEASAP